MRHNILGEEVIEFAWLNNEKVYAFTKDGYYFSKEPIKLLRQGKLTFSETTTWEDSFKNSDKILEILDTLYWKSIMDINVNNTRYKEYLFSANRTIENGIEDTIWVKDYECLIIYYINYETGLVYMTPAVMSTNIHDMYAFLSKEQLIEVRSKVESNT